ncbi:MAG: S41 family peptidase [Colwellia sp.]|nr:S41 family peptidase [Colwellia sp.]
MDKGLMLKILNILLLVCALIGCQEDKQDNYIITMDEQVCHDQSLRNIAMWDYMNDWYLWNDALDQNTVLNDFQSVEDLLANIKQKNPIDRYSFVISKQESDDIFINAQNFGYGMGNSVDETSHELIVNFVFDRSNAQKIGLSRGDRITEIAGQILSEVLTKSDFTWSGFWHTIDQSQLVEFTWRKPDGTILSQKMVQSEVTTNTVFATEVIESEIGKIGYLVYNSFIAPSHNDLNQAFAYFKEQNVDEFIVDLRYNHGGTSAMSNQLASQIGGDNVLGKIYNAPTNNANHVSDVEFFNLNNATHYLSLSKVVFITSGESASASEVVINALKPYLEVKLVGQKTYGKPVGMRMSQLCDEVVFAITHHNHNADGYGDFFDGIDVDCPAIDNVNGDWGSSNDAMLTEAVYLLENERCSSASKINKSQKNKLITKPSYRKLMTSQPFGQLSHEKK